jgi:hypothetical protein
MYDYDKTCAKFLEVNCKITDTKEEYDERNKTEKFSKCNYIASCGHQHVVFINVFFSRKTGLVCPSCKSKENATKKKELMKDDKLKFMKMELRCMNYFKEICKGFEIHKAFDGCRADLIVRPIGQLQDKWIGVQVKTTERNNHYEFHLENNYSDLIMLCICEDDKKIWLIPYEEINGVSKIHIGIKSKYNKYEIENISYLSEKLSEYYKITKKFTYEELDKPLCIYTEREKEFYRYRESKIDFLDFTYNDMEGIVYDFKIGEKKVQEKVGCIDKIKNVNVFCLWKNNGKLNGKQNSKCYDVGDNDYYWLNADDKKLFYVIPEQILIEKGYVGYTGHKKQLKINPKETKYNEWIQPYKFNYNSFGLFEKNRLLKILKIIL